MILYFSATGNSEYVADQIARSLGDRAASVETQSAELILRSGEILGIVAPAYFAQLPSVMRDYLERLRVFGYKGQYVFTLVTCGMTPGAASADMKQLLKKKNIHVCAEFSVQMPDTWTPIFDVTDEEKIVQQLDSAEDSIGEILSLIRREKHGSFLRSAVLSALLPVVRRTYDSSRKTKHLHAEDGCTGCGLCAERCPSGAIRMENGRPIWVKDSCAMCLRCLHSCPAFAIQYENKTQQHGQYHGPKTYLAAAKEKDE